MNQFYISLLNNNNSYKNYTLKYTLIRQLYTAWRLYVIPYNTRHLSNLLNNSYKLVNILNLQKSVNRDNPKPLLPPTYTKGIKGANASSKHKPLASKIFKIYLNISLYTYTLNSKVHPSFLNLYIVNTTKGSKVVNVSKFFTTWLSVCCYIYNVYFYNLKPILFGTVFFKKEICSLNWLSLSKLKVNWRYSKLLLFLVPTSRNSTSVIIYKLFNSMGLNNSIILDINYHKSTLMYLDKLSVFTLGVVPTSYDIKSVDLAIPVNIDNLFTQLFIVRLLVKFIKISENTKYTDYSNLWVKQNN